MALDVRALASDMDDAELAEAFDRAKSLTAEYRGNAHQFEQEIMNRMLARQATQIPAEGWLLEQKPGGKVYSYDIAILEGIRPWLGPGEWAQIVERWQPPVEYKVHTTRLQAMAKKRGPQFQQIVQRATSIVEGPPKVTVQRLPDLLPALEASVEQVAASGGPVRRTADR